MMSHRRSSRRSEKKDNEAKAAWTNWIQSNLCAHSHVMWAGVFSSQGNRWATSDDSKNVLITGNDISKLLDIFQYPPMRITYDGSLQKYSQSLTNFKGNPGILLEGRTFYPVSVRPELLYLTSASEGEVPGASLLVRRSQKTVVLLLCQPKHPPRSYCRYLERAFTILQRRGL